MILQSFISKNLSLNSKRFLSSNILCAYGWEAADPRTRSGKTFGNSLLDGKTWKQMDVNVRLVLTSSLCYVKDGMENLPIDLQSSPTLNGNYFLHKLAYDSTLETLKTGLLIPDKNLNPSMTIFNREKYDFICPLPSSKGPASTNNLAIANTISAAFRHHYNTSTDFRVQQLITKFQPMTIKSTATPKALRKHSDAPRQMHYDSMCVNEDAVKQGMIKDSKILLYDDVFTWGNTSEAARNLLLFEGAAEVDVITCFCTGKLCRSSIYDRLIQDKNSKEAYVLKKSTLIKKFDLCWNGQNGIQEWKRQIESLCRYPCSRLDLQ